MSKIQLSHIDKFYGENHVLRDVNLTIEDGDFMTLLGPSGCGKTTTLRVISGLEKAQHGTMTIDDKMIIDADKAFFEAPSKRGLNLVFQSYALWPHMTVFENVAFGLKIKKMKKEEIEETVMRALKTMRIEEYRGRYPNELSGGQQQRVAPEPSPPAPSSCCWTSPYPTWTLGCASTCGRSSSVSIRRPAPPSST